MRRSLALFAIGAWLSAGPGLSGAAPEALVPPACARAVLLDPPVRQRLHTDRPSRQPLLVSERHLEAKELDLEVPFRVRIVKGDDPGHADAFQFMSVLPDEHDHLVVTFKFPPEGLVGRATLAQGQGGCAVLDRDIYEK